MQDEGKVSIALTENEAYRWIEILDACQSQLAPIKHMFVKMLLLEIRKKLEFKLNAAKKQITLNEVQSNERETNGGYPDY